MTELEVQLKISKANARAAATRYGLGNVPHGIISLLEQPKQPHPERSIVSSFADGKMTALTVSEDKYRATRYIPTKHNHNIQADFLERGLEWFKQSHPESKSQFALWLELGRILGE
jgi:hypothetical protein